MSALVLSVDEVVEAIGVPFDEWAHQCHGISIAIVKSGLLPASRVARGSCDGVGGQHSWVVCSTDPGACYDRSVPPVDRVGMLTYLNPGGLYLAGPDAT